MIYCYLELVLLKTSFTYQLPKQNTYYKVIILGFIYYFIVYITVQKFKMSNNFVKATSENLPKVVMFAVNNYIRKK